MKPNILYLHSHDTGRYIQPYGYAVPTPNLQTLAEQGMLFRQCHNAAPTCSPSRSALLCGQSAHGCGQLGLVNRGFNLRHPERHLANLLRSAGYSTALAGIQHELPSDRAGELGYDRILAGGDDPSQAAAAFLAEDCSKPFFLSVGFFETHRGFPEDPLPEVDPRYVHPPEPFSDSAQTRLDWARFMKSAAILDRRMGAVLGALSAAGLAENTLVICTTDHGVAFPRMKCNLTDAGTGVMLILRGPGGFDGGKVTDAMVSHLDVVPTICEVAGIAAPDWLEGVSLAPLVETPAAEIREELFAEVNYHALYEPMRSVRTQRYKYICLFHDRPTVLLPDCDDGPTKRLWVDSGWSRIPQDREQLYDLVFDPNEQNNLAACPAMRPLADAMNARLQRWMKATDDPLLGGPVPAPKGAQINDPDAPGPGSPLTVVP